MAKGEMIIDDNLCKGCGYCVEYCSRDCLEMAGRLSAKGIQVPSITAPERCNGCGICGWMCPDFAVEVYKYVEESD